MIRVQIPIRPATDPTNLAGLVVDPRGCGVCGYTPDPDERVVGACVPGYHDLKLVAMHRAPIVSKAARDAEVRAMNGERRDTLGQHLALDPVEAAKQAVRKYAVMFARVTS